MFFDGNVGLGHRRLSIFDLSEAGAQPMLSRDGRYIIVHNGEIYNWPEIRQQLKFKNWVSKTDTETILQAYIEKGPQCLHDFNGMFAFAIWDKKERELFIARDRIGIKPLYYGFHDSRFYFASEPKAFFAGDFPKQVNISAIYDFLRWGSIDHCSETFFANIKVLQPGHYIRYKQGGDLETKCYWNLVDIVLGTPSVDYPDIVDDYTQLLESSIDLQLRSDVPVGVFLSGGVDSSIVTSCLAQKLDPKKFTTYTYEFDSKDTGEGIYANAVAKLLNINNVVASLSVVDIPIYLPKALYYQDMPITSIRCLASQKLYEKAKRAGTTVILEGHGGDHIGGGFEYYFISYALDIARQEGLDKALKVLDEYMVLYRVPEEKKLAKVLMCLAASQQPGIATQDGTTFVRQECLAKELIESEDSSRVSYCRPFRENLLNAQYIDLMHHNLPRVLRYRDRESMASGCESRLPLLDHRLVELGFSSTLHSRVQGTQQRYFMQQAAESFLPDRIRRHPKRSIVDPQRKWLQTDLKHWVLDIFNSKEFWDRGIFKPQEVLKEYRRYCQEHVPVTAFHIFQYINIEMWFRVVIDQPLGLERTEAQVPERHEAPLPC